MYKRMGNLLFKVIAGVLGLYLAERYVPGVDFTGTWQDLVLVGVALGLINTFIKPLLKMITLPLRVITLGLFGLIINLVILWAIDIFFTELIIQGFFPLLWATLIIWGLTLFFFPKRNHE